MTNPNPLTQKAINTIRFLAADGVQKAKSGHPGLPMGAAGVAYALWTSCMRYNPLNPHWPNRDRFILSGGHGSMLLYSMLYLTGYGLELDELKSFRQWGSRTPGHPEYGVTPGVELTTGPLGQGFASGVGMAIASEHLAAVFNRPGFPIFDYFIYAIVTDGDLMEGVSSEAASLAGHLGLGRLIYLYDDNHISIEGGTHLAFSEDRMKRFEAYGWHTQSVTLDHQDETGAVQAIEQALEKAKADPRPSIIATRTVIGYGLPSKQGTEKAHGEPAGDEELDAAKRALGWPIEPRFYVPIYELSFFRQAVDRGEEAEKQWNQMMIKYELAYPELGLELRRRLNGDLPAGWESDLPVFAPDAKGLASREASGKVLNALAQKLPELLGGSADLAPSNKTWLNGLPDFQKDRRDGRNFHFGVREHAMGAIVNGMAVNGGLIPYGGTFLVFADYMRGALRVSALSHYPSIWVFTHDSIGVGEDGPTHQPVEQICSLRAIPNMVVLRPGDANETREAWKVAINRRDGPTALALTRQALPTLDRKIFGKAEGLWKGAYILAELVGGGPEEVILMASGSEVNLIVEAGKVLMKEGITVLLVSFPSWELFKAQPQEYRDLVLPPKLTKRVAVEAGIGMGWERWVGDQGIILSIEQYGASAPYQTIYQRYGLTVEAVIEAARTLTA